MDECHNLFINDTIDAINSRCPLKKVPYKLRIILGQQKVLSMHVRKRNRPYKKFIKNRNNVNEQRYKMYKNELIFVLRKCKQNILAKLLINIRKILRS